MTTSKHSSDNCLATVTETTVYLSNLEGKIYKHFPIQHFNAQPFTIEVEFPSDFEAEKTNYNQRQANKQQERANAHNAWVAAQREIRKQNVIAIWNWRKGRTEAYKIYTCDVPVETFGKNPSYSGSVSDIIFDEIVARKQFIETIGSWTPEFDNSVNNVQGEVALYHFDIKLAERLEITSIEELNEIAIDFEPIENEYFSPEIPEKALIVDMYEHYGNFNRKYYTVNQVQVKGDFTGSHTFGYRKMNNYSDLWGQEVYESINDFISKYESDEDAMQELFAVFSLETAKSYGLDEAYYSLFETTEK